MTDRIVGLKPPTIWTQVLSSVQVAGKISHTVHMRAISVGAGPCAVVGKIEEALMMMTAEMSPNSQRNCALVHGAVALAPSAVVSARAIEDGGFDTLCCWSRRSELATLVEQKQTVDTDTQRAFFEFSHSS